MIKKLVTTALLTAILSCAAPPPISFVVPLVKLKPKTDHKDWLHKLVYVSEAIAAGISLGFDASSTLIAVRPDQTITGQSGAQTSVPGISESNPLYATKHNGVYSFSVAKMFILKTTLAAVPPVSTYLLHRFRDDNTTTDVLSISISGGLAGLFSWAGIHNLNAASANDAAAAAARLK